MLPLVWQSLLALTFASRILATPLVAEPIINHDLVVRQTNTSVCSPNGFESMNGLNFTTYCGQNNPFNDAQQPFPTDSFQDCMEHCSRFWGDGEGCFGVVWVGDSKACWIRNSTTSTKGLIPLANHYSALTVLGNMDGFDTSCPGTDKSINDLAGVSGLKYTLNCNKVVGGYDTCWDGPQPCWVEPYRGFYHTKTLEECLQICVDQHPLCKAVSWSPDLKIGFANCWPKTGFPDTLNTPSPKQGVLHTATITQIDTVDRTCPSSKSYKAQNNKNFDVHCGQVNTGTNITAIHTQNVTACIDACANLNQNCTGISFDSTLASGFKNCYLQNSTSTINDSPSATYAILSNAQSNNGSISANSPSSSSSSSKAWIAGAVIGPLVALGLLAFALIFWRRRKARSAPVPEKDGHEFGAYGPAPAYSSGSHGSSQPLQPQEMHGQKNQIHYAGPGPLPLSEIGDGGAANELPASTKYAHAHTAKGPVSELA